jgi:hypothetical protein
LDINNFFKRVAHKFEFLEQMVQSLPVLEPLEQQWIVRSNDCEQG